MDLIDSQTTRAIAKALDGVSQRHKAITGNIANAETPGYKSLKVSFEENLKQAIDAESNPQQAMDLAPGSLKTTNAKHINPNPTVPSTELVQPSIERTKFMYRYDQNGVDIEHEMADLAKNAGRYQVLSKLESKQFSALRAVIKGGGG